MIGFLADEYGIKFFETVAYNWIIAMDVNKSVTSYKSVLPARLQAFYEFNQNDTTPNSALSNQFPPNSETLLLEINPSVMTDLDNISA
ncbi:hypothetical protein Tco_0830883 [Tanacetum coccineum]